MIDWVTAALDLDASLLGRQLPNDRTVRIDAQGTIKYEREDWISCPGSFDDRLAVRVGQGALWMSGNPVKYFQGHNCFGTDDLRGLVRAAFLEVCDRVDFPLTVGERSAVDFGATRLTRVDCTVMVDYGSPQNASAALREIEKHGTVAYRGRSSVRKGSVIFGSGSREWNLKLYLKGDELRSRSRLHGLGDKFTEKERKALRDYADPTLRVEAMLRGPVLRARDLGLSGVWKEEDVMSTVERAVAGLQAPKNEALGELVVLSLPRRLRATYELWRQGVDVEQMISRATFYRHRSDLLPYGVDIRIMPEGVSRPAPVEVVPLREVIRGRVVGIPEWAIGTPLYYEPPKLEAVACG